MLAPSMRRPSLSQLTNVGQHASALMGARKIQDAGLLEASGAAWPGDAVEDAGSCPARCSSRGVRFLRSPAHRPDSGPCSLSWACTPSSLPLGEPRGPQGLGRVFCPEVSPATWVPSVGSWLDPRGLPHRCPLSGSHLSSSSPGLQCHLAVLGFACLFVLLCFDEPQLLCAALLRGLAG